MINNFFKNLNKTKDKTRLKSSKLKLNLDDGLTSSTRFTEIVKEAYFKNAIAYRCISLISQVVGQMPLVVTRQDKELQDHPVSKLINKPNLIQNKYDFFERIVTLLLLSGSSYILARGIYDKKMPTEIWSLMPNTVSSYKKQGEFVPEYYRYTGSGRTEIFYFDQITGRCDILNIAKSNPLNEPFEQGFSPSLAGGFGIDVMNEGNKWNYYLLKNNAKPSGAFVFPPDVNLSEEDFERFKAELKSETSGSENAGDSLVLEGGVEWKEMSKNPADLDYLKGKLEAAREICIAYGVPAQLIGLPDISTYSNYKEARLAFYEDTALPLAKKVVSELERGFNLVLPVHQQVKIEIDTDQIEALAPKRQAHYEFIENSKFLTVNEKRYEMGYPEVAGGDELYVNQNQVPLSMLGMFEPKPDNEE